MYSKPTTKYNFYLVDFKHIIELTIMINKIKIQYFVATIIIFLATVPIPIQMLFVYDNKYTINRIYIEKIINILASTIYSLVSLESIFPFFFIIYNFFFIFLPLIPILSFIILSSGSSP